MKWKRRFILKVFVFLYVEPNLIHCFQNYPSETKILFLIVVGIIHRIETSSVSKYYPLILEKAHARLVSRPYN
jgi:hypothetical protein